MAALLDFLGRSSVQCVAELGADLWQMGGARNGNDGCGLGDFGVAYFDVFGDFILVKIELVEPKMFFCGC